jgi:hypothetical protein
MLIYKLLGDGAQQEFARSWGVSYGMNAAAEWQDIAKEAVKGAIVLAILERLCLTRPGDWLEARPCRLRVAAWWCMRRVESPKNPLARIL